MCILMKWKELTLSLSSCKKNNAKDIGDWDGSFHDTKKLTTNTSFHNTKKEDRLTKKKNIYLHISNQGRFKTWSLFPWAWVCDIDCKRKHGIISIQKIGFNNQFFHITNIFTSDTKLWEGIGFVKCITPSFECGMNTGYSYNTKKKKNIQP